MRWRVAIPLLLVLAYGLAFGIAAFGGSTPAFDDHPGQLYRARHVVAYGWAPWAWDPGWFAGYPELQFYPPGYSYAVAALHGILAPGLSSREWPLDRAYQAMLWITYLAPGVTTYAALVRILGNGWFALPGAFVALTLSAGLASGVEGGVHMGMLPARLGWALLPLLVVALRRWIEDGGRTPWLAVPLVAAITLTHPTHLPTAVALVALAALCGAGPPHRRFAQALGVLALAAGLTAFWTVPLIAHRADTRALAFGALSTAESFLDRPLLLVLTAGAFVAAGVAGQSRTARVVVWLPWVMAAVVFIDAAGLEPAGVRWLPADRVADGFWLAAVLAGGVAAGRGLERLARQHPGRAIALSLATLLALVVVSRPGRVLTLQAHAPDWPSYDEVRRGLRLDDLWAEVRRAPAGRVLFLRSGVPLVHGSDWWRPHTHVTALTPAEAGREIVHGTFTHPSPIAVLVYRGDAGPGPIRVLAERLDGVSLFGRPLDDLDAATFDRYTDSLGVSVVVALEDDAAHLRALDENTQFTRRPPSPPFVIYVRRMAAVLPARDRTGRVRMTLTGAPGEWVGTRLGYYPLWQARDDHTPLPIRRNDWGLLEVRLDRRDPTIELVYAAGPFELGGLVASVVAVLVWVGALVWSRESRASSDVDTP